jgi:FtsP/CotA-like multicopper oxidase with cupredoxin domain
MSVQLKYKASTNGTALLDINKETITTSASASSTGFNPTYVSNLSENLTTELLNTNLENLTKQPIKESNTQITLNTNLKSFFDESFNVPLPIPTLNNLIGLQTYTNSFIESTTHEFYPNYPYNLATYPTFTSDDGQNMTFGLPTLKVERFAPNEAIQLNFSNNTSYTFNLHWHGNNFTPTNDGATTPTLFGEGTKIGDTLTFNATFFNNTCVTWNHAHPMFYSSPLTYLGFIAFVLILNPATSHIDDIFVYGNNWIPIAIHDITFDKQGVIDLKPIYDGNWRGDYTCVNGTTTIPWDEEYNPTYISKFYQVSSNNLIKLSFLNATASFRCCYFGVCDKYNNPRPFYYIQTDQGYRNPFLTDILYISVGVRTTILFDIKDFPDEIAYVFLYGFDLTDNNGFYYDTRISPGLITTINGKTVTTDNGVLPVPSDYKLLKFLKITYDGTYQNNLNEVLKSIKKTVFGKNYDFVEKLPVPVESINYENYLNKDYFYNLPDFGDDVPKRNLLFFFDQYTSKLNGATDYINGTVRYMADAWNSYEYEMYIKTKSDLYLPTCLFSISKYSGDYLTYSNYQMQDNHLLIININFNNVCVNECNCGERCSNSISVSISFPESVKPMNIKEWTNLVNYMYSKTTFVNENGTTLTVSDILEYSWEPYLYRFDYLKNLDDLSPKKFYNDPLFLKSVKIINKNKSNYSIELKAPFTLLTFFGKPFTAMDIRYMDPPMNTTPMDPMNMTPLHTKHMGPMNMTPMDTSMNNLQVVFPFAGSINGNIEYPNDNLFSIKVKSYETYYGFCDGFLNDNFYNFSVKKDSTEKWCYNNGDTQDTHPLHFHMTSGFLTSKDNIDNKLFFYENGQEIFNLLSYSKDIYTVPPNNYITIRVTFPTFSSEMGTIPFLGYMVHCHFMAHHDMNMMNQFFVYIEKQNYFN